MIKEEYDEIICKIENTKGDFLFSNLKGEDIPFFEMVKYVDLNNNLNALTYDSIISLSDTTIPMIMDKNKVNSIKEQSPFGSDEVLNSIIMEFRSDDNKYMRYILTCSAEEWDVQNNKGEMKRSVTINLIGLYFNEDKTASLSFVYAIIIREDDKYIISECALCPKICNRKNIIRCIMRKDREHPDKLTTHTSCKLSKLNMEECCNNQDFIPIKIEDAAKIYLYANRIYNNRNKLARKNSILRKDYVPVNVRIDSANDEKTTNKKRAEYIPLYDLSVRERKGEIVIRDGSRHEHHNSPREHIRREHIRVMKSGKIVHVKSSVVSKGNKVKYELK